MDLLKDKGAAMGGATAGIAEVVRGSLDAEHRRGQAVDAVAIAQLFTEARTHHAFRDLPVSDALLRRALDLAKMGPTSANQQPLRVLFLRSTQAKERLRPALMPGNVGKGDGCTGRRDHVL